MKNIDEILDKITKTYGNSSDIVFRKLNISKKQILYVYLESVSSDDKISDFLMKDLSWLSKNSTLEDLFETLKNTIFNSHFMIVNDFKDIYYLLSCGYTIVFIENDSRAIAIETKSSLDRGITESTSESVIRGPKDSFTENNSINLGLIRKRIKDPNLWFEEVLVGKRTKTKVTIAFIKDIVNDSIIDEIKSKLKKINIDGILDSGNIREFIIGKKSSFPKFKSTERPDLACISLLEGKVVILVENSPFVLITPGLFVDFLHSPEDIYQKSFNANTTRFLRLIAFILTITIPSFYIAVTTFNQQVIPNELLISLANQRKSVPFPTAIEITMLITSFEILRESDIRIPNAMGSAIGIVGALILGDAAVNAGIISPIAVIIVALTAICGLLYTDIDFVNGARLWRFIFIFFTIIAGLVGFVIAAILLIIELCSLEMQGVPYLAPISPFSIRNQAYGLFRRRNNKVKLRPTFLHIKNYKRKGD